MQKLTPFLWYKTDALGTAKYYKSVFGDNVEILNEEALNNTPSGEVQVVTMIVFGIQMRIMAAGEHHEFNDAISFEIACQTQAEIDKYWNALTADGKEQSCGWCIDKFGVRWQIVPENLGDFIQHKAGMAAMLKMTKISIPELEAAVNA